MLFVPPSVSSSLLIDIWLYAYMHTHVAREWGDAVVRGSGNGDTEGCSQDSIDKLNPGNDWVSGEVERNMTSSWSNCNLCQFWYVLRLSLAFQNSRCRESKSTSGHETYTNQLEKSHSLQEYVIFHTFSAYLSSPVISCSELVLDVWTASFSIFIPWSFHIRILYSQPHTSCANRYIYSNI